MKELICINPKNYKLTEDNVYTIVIDEGATVMIVNDSNKTVRYYKDLFKEVEEEMIPEEISVVVRTEQNFVDSIATNGESTTYVDFNNEIATVNNHLSIINNESSFSCGIKNVVNIGDQILEIYNVVSGTAEDVEEDLELLTKAVIKHHFKSFIKKKSNDGIDGALFLMSCNINDDGLDEETIDILNEISDFNTVPEVNPNSSNKIMLWGFYKSNLDN